MPKHKRNPVRHGHTIEVHGEVVTHGEFDKPAKGKKSKLPKRSRSEPSGEYSAPEVYSNKLVHIEDLYSAFQDFTDEAQRAINSMSPLSASWRETMEAARTKFRAFCDSHKLAIDWTPRD